MWHVQAYTNACTSHKAACTKKKKKKNVCFLGPGAVSAHFSLLKQKLELGLCQTEKWVSLQFHVEKKKKG